MSNLINQSCLVNVMALKFVTHSIIYNTLSTNTKECYKTEKLMKCIYCKVDVLRQCYGKNESEETYFYIEKLLLTK